MTVAEDLFFGDSEVGSLLRKCLADTDGDRSGLKMSLGSVKTWSPSLKIALSIIFNSPCPMFIVWGSNHTLFYNDACQPLLGPQYFTALGQSAHNCWVAWSEIKHDLEQVLTTGQLIRREKAAWLDSQNNASAANYFAVSYSPIADEQGAVGGVLITVAHNKATSTENADRKPAEFLLDESNTRFKLALEVTGTVYWERDLRTNQIILSSNFTDSTTSQVVNYQDALMLVHPDDRDYVHQTNEMAIAQCGSFEFEHRLMEPNDQQWRWVLARGKVLTDAVGKPTQIVGVSIDISNRRCSEAELEWAKAELQLSLAQRAAGAGLWDWNIATNRSTWSEEYYQIYGFDPATPPSYDTWLRAILEPDRERADRAVREALTDRTNLNVEFRILHPVLGPRWLVAIGQTFYDTSGKPIRMTGISLDITDRKQVEESLRLSEDRYRTLANAVPQLMWTSAPDGTIQFFNQRWVEYTGIPMELGLATWTQIIHPEDARPNLEKRARAIQAGEAYEIEVRLKQFDQTYRWHLARVVPLKDENGRVLQWYGTATDIDNVKQAEQERERLLQSEQAAREQAEAANRIKDEFLAVLSHELRSPLNPILGWAKLLQSRDLDEQTTKQALATIERNAKLQAQLIEDLLDVSRILRGKLLLNTIQVDLISTIEAALETVRLAAEAKNIQIQKTLDPSARQVMGDAARLQQVIWNLLSNAVKFTPAGGQITVQLEKVMGSGSSVIGKESEQLHKFRTPHPILHYAQITIVDTGKGIQPNFLPYVFEYFRQEDGSTTRKFGGLGLGLAIVRHLTELHGGTVSAASLGEGLGATFTVQLPLVSAAIKPTQDDLHITPDVHLSGLQILIVDDEPDIRDILAFVAEQAGAIVRVARSASEAFRLIEQSLPDVLICDIGMPEVDGYMLIRQLRALPPQQGGQILAIALTAYAGELDQQQALAAGFQQHIAKPVEPEVLVRAIAALVNRQ